MPVLDKVMTMIYNSVPFSIGKCLATYIWIDDTGESVKGKTWTLNSIPETVQDIPIWNFEGSLTYQSLGVSSNTYLYPVALFKDPFLKGDHKLVMCETYKYDQTPTDSNKRTSCNQAMDATKHLKPWFGLEQYYCILDMASQPYEWPKGCHSSPQGLEGMWANKTYGRDVMESHYRACVFAGINITGTNTEVLLSPLKYQIGPCKGIDIADQAWVSRYILHRIAEDHGVVVTLNSKPDVRNLNGSGAHMTFSTQAMRDESGITEVKKAMQKLSKKNIEVVDLNGETKNEKVVGNLEPSVMAHKGISVRISKKDDAEKKDYLDVRRPSSDCDPYCVAETIIRTCYLDE